MRPALCMLHISKRLWFIGSRAPWAWIPACPLLVFSKQVGPQERDFRHLSRAAQALTPFAALAPVGPGTEVLSPLLLEGKKGHFLWGPTGCQTAIPSGACTWKGEDLHPYILLVLMTLPFPPPVFSLVLGEQELTLDFVPFIACMFVVLMHRVTHLDRKESSPSPTSRSRSLVINVHPQAHKITHEKCLAQNAKLL